MSPTTLSDADSKMLAQKLAAIVNQPDITAKLNEQGAEIVVMDPAQLNTFFEKERKRWAAIVASADIKLD